MPEFVVLLTEMGTAQVFDLDHPCPEANISGMQLRTTPGHHGGATSGRSSSKRSRVWTQVLPAMRPTASSFSGSMRKFCFELGVDVEAHDFAEHNDSATGGVIGEDDLQELALHLSGRFGYARGAHDFAGDGRKASQLKFIYFGAYLGRRGVGAWRQSRRRRR